MLNSDTTITPWEDVIICTDPPEDQTEEGVIIGIAKSDEEKARTPEKGIIVAIGKSSEGKKLPVALKPGDLVFYERYTANKIPYGGREYNFIRFKFIMGAIVK